MLSFSKKVYCDGFDTSTIIVKSNIIEVIANQLLLYKYLQMTEFGWRNLILALDIAEYAINTVILLLERN